MNSANSDYQPPLKRENFMEGGLGFEQYPMKKVYSKKEVREEFEKIWGDEVVTLLAGGNQYIARGHLMANTDGVLIPFQRATFLYVNCMPQFQNHNGCNWLRVEESVREYSAKYGDDLEIFTGTHGIMRFKNVLLYISSRRKQHLLPIPNIFYKIVINRGRGKGMVIVGVNNVLATIDDMGDNNDISEYVYCDDDVSDDVNLFRAKITEATRHDISIGYTYVCRVRDFLEGARMHEWIEYKDFLNYELMTLRDDHME